MYASVGLNIRYFVIINLRKKQRHATCILYRAVTFTRIHGELTLKEMYVSAFLYAISTDINSFMVY